MKARSLRNLTFILAWSTCATFGHATVTLPKHFPWEELLDDMRNDVDTELPYTFILDFQKDIINRMQNTALDLNRPYMKTRTSARHTPDTEKIGHESNFNLYLFELMITRYGISKATALRLLRKRLTEFCQMKPRVCDPTTPYRSVDGTCNNIQHPYWGASFRPFDRILPAAYEDGFNEPRGGMKNTHLPNPRVISTTIHYDVVNPDSTITNLVPQLGQFIDHDMTLAPEGDKHCCTNDQGHKDCWPIKIPSDDPFFSKLNSPQTCMDFTRSTPFCFPGTGIREQFNILTAFLDASQVYGSEPERAEELRWFNRGRLSVNLKNPSMLPTVAEVEEKLNKRIAFMGKYLAGDERVNEMPALTSMHILLVREHNRIADEIYNLRPDWVDDKIFEEARRILIAEWQNIVYGEYLPVILGENTMRKYSLSLGEDDEYSFYNPMLNPTIFLAFATAAYRFGHTLINGIIQLYRGLANVGNYALKDNFFESEQIDRDNGDGYNLILGGLMVQNAQTYDPFVTDALTNSLLRNRTVEFGSDLIARNIQRERAWNPTVCSLQTSLQFKTLSTWAVRPREIIPQTWDLLKTLYRSPMEIDLFTGGLSEVPVLGAYSGATFNCLKAMQFYRTKYGDRFFFTHANQAGSFNSDQLQNIRKRKFGDIMCENSDLEMTTINVFRTPSANNPQIFCNDPSRGRLDVELLIEQSK